MTNYSIAEEYTLPSLGKVYDQKINPIVKLRSMTTEEEMKRLAPSDRPYKNLCEIIDDCMVEPCGISSYDMCIADYQFLLHKLRVVTYGPDYNTSSTCPFCGSVNQHIVNLDELNVEHLDESDIQKYTKFKLPKSGHELTICIQTPRMVDNITVENNDIKRRSKGQSSDQTFILTLRSLVETVDGKVLDPIKKEQFLRKLPMMDTNYIMKHAQKLVESFGMDNSVSNVCPMCGLDYNSHFRISAEFFGPSIDI